MIRFVLTDIEGTTSSIHFVHQVLFPYARKHMDSFLDKNADKPEVQKAMEQTAATLREEQNIENAGLPEIKSALQEWMTADRKHTALKALQGMLWKEGYEKGEFTGHIYGDVPGRLADWHNSGIGLGIYSSGSVDAQKLLFRYSDFGDLTRHFSAYFDTRIGAKREAESYRKIAAELGMPAGEILFLSDMEAELDAAHEAGMQTTQLLREGTEPSARHPHAADFNAVKI